MIMVLASTGFSQEAPFWSYAMKTTFCFSIKDLVIFYSYECLYNIGVNYRTFIGIHERLLESCNSMVLRTSFQNKTRKGFLLILINCLIKRLHIF
jgi:hypothetical protein